MTLRYDSRRALWKQANVELTLTEFNIVAFLVENSARDVSYREIYDIVHGEGFMAGDGEVGFRTNVRAFIKRIRQKFRDADPNFASINNYPGFGYRWLDGNGQ
jgi:two-component system response regulator ChvI